MKKKILLIIPAYNEEKNIKKVYDSIVDYNKKNKTDYHVIVINDGSKDNTKEILENNNIPHINLVNNLGIGGAVQTGYKYAKEFNYDVAIQFDGDGQHDIRYAKKLINPIIDGQADLVIGSRFLEKDMSDFKSTRIRRIGINWISFLIKICTGRKLTDTTSGFRAANKKVISLFADNYPIDSAEPSSFVTISRKGYNTLEVSVSMKEREGGVSSITNHFWKPIYYMINVSLSIVITSLKSRRNS
ncbi:MAG: glycosyltransferase family 2 protein [bacterium]|nr:glycosyltransferase family 2 protein [bacterium]